MKATMRILPLLLLTLLFVPQARAQRDLPGQKGIELAGGTVDGLLLRHPDECTSFYGSIAMTRANRGGTHWLFGVNYLQKDYAYGYQILPKAQFTGEAGLFFPLVKDRSHVFRMTLGLSALAGYESSN